MARLLSRLDRSVPRRFRGFRPRVAFVVGLLALAGLILAGRAYDLQVLQHERLARLAQRQSQRTIRLDGRRGPIKDRFGDPLALSIKADSLYAHPGDVTDPALEAFQLARLLNLEAGPLEQRLRSGDAFVWIKRHVTPIESSAVQALKLPGVHVTKEYTRVYPQRTFAAPLLGFTGVDTQGLSGLEYAYDSYLKGAEGYKVIDRDALGRTVLTGNDDFPTGGGSIRLTIHPAIQYIADQELSRAVQQSEAAFGVVVVLRTRTGEILAMSHAPGFNPNDYLHYDRASYFDRAVTSGYEPGSTFKVFTISAALESGVVQPDSVFFCENGEWHHYDSIIHDTEPHGWLGLPGVIRYSSNICAAKIGLLVPAPVFHAYLKKFGFGHAVGIFTDADGRRLAGEAEGYLPPAEKWTPVDHAAISFGHGILVSPLQLVTAVNAIANGGVMVRPRLVLDVRDPEGHLLEQNRYAATHRVISERTAHIVRDLMKGVVSPDGTGKRAAVPGYVVAGKTGTTEIYDLKAHGYSQTKHIASFVGFVPADHPALTILVVIEKPKKGRFGGTVAAPVFSNIARRALPLLGVWPNDAVHHAQAVRSPAAVPAGAALTGTLAPH